MASNEGDRVCEAVVNPDPPESRIDLQNEGRELSGFQNGKGLYDPPFVIDPLRKPRSIPDRAHLSAKEGSDPKGPS